MIPRWSKSILLFDTTMLSSYRQCDQRTIVFLTPTLSPCTASNALLIDSRSGFFAFKQKCMFARFAKNTAATESLYESATTASVHQRQASYSLSRTTYSAHSSNCVLNADDAEGTGNILWGWPCGLCQGVCSPYNAANVPTHNINNEVWKIRQIKMSATV